MMFMLYVVDVTPGYPEFDCQIWHQLPWKGTSIPGCSWLGEWAWVGRLYDVAV